MRVKPSTITSPGKMQKGLNPILPSSSRDPQTVTTARALQFASMTKMAHLALESFPQFCTQLTLGSMNAFNEGYVDLSHLTRASVVGSAWAVSAGIANFLYERRGVMISPNCHR